MRRHTRLILLAAFAAGCATNPVTGRSELALISEAQEIQMGREYAEQVKATLGLYEDPDLQAYVSRLGMALAGIESTMHSASFWVIVTPPMRLMFHSPEVPSSSAPDSTMPMTRSR